MSDYYYRNNRRKKRNRREKIGFYTAFSICLIAVCMAVYSTYNTISVNKSTKNTAQTPTSAVVQVNENVQGVTETLSEPKLNIEVPTATSFSEIDTKPSSVEASEENKKTALETMLSADLTLNYPLNSKNVIREYTEKSIYYKTPNVWKAHMGVDFAGEIGDDVVAMTGGAVTKIYDNKMYGKTVEISTNNAVCIYSGFGTVNVKKGDSVETGNKLGVLGSVPFESDIANHIHISVKIDGKYADPLSFIGNNE